MNRATMTRLAKLEGVKGGDVRLVCITRRIIEADGTELEPESYRDGRGNMWMREPGESFQAFRERAEAGAIAAASPGGCAVTIPCARAAS